MTKNEVQDTREEMQGERGLKARCVEAGWDLASPGCSRMGLEDWSYSLALDQTSKALEDKLNSGCS